MLAPNVKTVHILSRFTVGPSAGEGGDVDEGGWDEGGWDEGGWGDDG